MMLSTSLYLSACTQGYQVPILSAPKPSVQYFLLDFARDRCQALLERYFIHMCSQETPNVNNLNIEDKDSLLPKGLHHLGAGLGGWGAGGRQTCSMFHASVQFSDSKTQDRFSPLSMSQKIGQKMQLFLELVFDNCIKVISCGVKTELQPPLYLLLKIFNTDICLFYQQKPQPQKMADLPSLFKN